jgi:hypothetical protein
MPASSRLAIFVVIGLYPADTIQAFLKDIIRARHHVVLLPQAELIRAAVFFRALRRRWPWASIPAYSGYRRDRMAVWAVEF